MTISATLFSLMSYTADARPATTSLLRTRTFEISTPAAELSSEPEATEQTAIPDTMTRSAKEDLIQCISGSPPQDSTDAILAADSKGTSRVGQGVRVGVEEVCRSNDYPSRSGVYSLPSSTDQVSLERQANIDIDPAVTSHGISSCQGHADRTSKGSGLTEERRAQVTHRDAGINVVKYIEREN